MMPSPAAGQGSRFECLHTGSAILEEMVRDLRTTIHAEDLQAGSSHDIPRQTQILQN